MRSKCANSYSTAGRAGKAQVQRGGGASTVLWLLNKAAKLACYACAEPFPGEGSVIGDCAIPPVLSMVEQENQPPPCPSTADTRTKAPPIIQVDDFPPVIAQFSLSLFTARCPSCRSFSSFSRLFSSRLSFSSLSLLSQVQHLPPLSPLPWPPWHRPPPPQQGPLLHAP